MRGICAIEKHREFSMLIGVELPINEISNDLLTCLRAVNLKEKPHDALSRKDWIVINTVIEIGRSGEFSESYNNLLAHNLQSEEFNVSPPYILSYVPKREGLFRKGLKKMGQTSLLIKFDELFPTAPAAVSDISGDDNFPYF